MKLVRFRISSRPLLLAAAVPLLLAVGCASSAPPAAAGPDTQAPAAIAGEWGVQIKMFDHPVDGVLRFTIEHRALIGSFSDDEGNQSELSNLRVENGKISWKMDRKNGTLVAHGRIDGTIMSGKMKLKSNEDADDSGFGVSGGGRRGGGGGRRIGELDSFSWTAIKRAAQESPK